MDTQIDTPNAKVLFFLQFNPSSTFIQFHRCFTCFSQAWYDGGFTDNQPVPPTGFTIRVSPFSGNSEICPRDESRVLSEMYWRNMHVYVNSTNMRRAGNILYPPRKRLLAKLYGSGYSDALQYVNKNKLT